MIQIIHPLDLFVLLSLPVQPDPRFTISMDSRADSFFINGEEFVQDPSAPRVNVVDRFHAL